MLALTTTILTSITGRASYRIIRLARFLNSLNHLQRKRELERVARENGELVKRLEKVEPIYKLTDWVDDWEKNEKLHEMITCYPESMHVKVGTYISCHYMSLAYIHTAQ